MTKGEENQPLICSCNAIILNDNIDKWNGCNEEGEEYGEVTAICEACNKYWATSQWGEWDDFEDAKSYLQEYINDSSNNSKNDR